MVEKGAGKVAAAKKANNYQAFKDKSKPSDIRSSNMVAAKGN